MKFLMSFFTITNLYLTKKLRIAVNTRFLLKNKLEGIGRFTFEVLKRIVLNHPEVEFLFCFDRKYDASFLFADNVKAVIIYPPARHPFLYYLWFEHALPKALEKFKPDVFLSLDGFLPLHSKIKSLAVIHDIAFEHYNNDVDWLSQKYYKYYFPKFARKANKIVTVSNFSKNDIANAYQLNSSEIDVIYNGVSEIFKPISTEEKKNISASITNGNPYFMYHGSMHPRKNIITLLKAFEQFTEKNNSNHYLVLAGRKAWKTAEMDKFYAGMKYKDKVIFTGKLDDTTLANTLATATISIYPSYYEGFGLPVLEAFACGVPVITTKNSAMEEIAKGAAYLFDPFNVEDLENAMSTALVNPSETTAMINKGLSLTKEYTWDNSAKKLWESLLKIQLQ